jgi:hypothetical protein
VLSVASNRVGPGERRHRAARLYAQLPEYFYAMTAAIKRVRALVQEKTVMIPCPRAASETARLFEQADLLAFPRQKNCRRKPRKTPSYDDCVRFLMFRLHNLSAPFCNH